MQRRRHDSAGFDLHPRPALESLHEQLDDLGTLERLATGHDQEPGVTQSRCLLPQLVPIELMTRREIPTVLGVAPMADDIATLEANEVRRSAGRGTLSLQG